MREGTSFTTTLRPPIRFPDPGRICIVVSPPARARGICGSCGQTECSAQTLAVTGLVNSFPSLFASTPGAGYTPMCECTSMIPGVTYFPVPSITNASAGATIFVPTAAIFPSRNRIDPFAIVGPAAVNIVAFRISVVRRGKGLYVLGNGSAFGRDVPPGPGDGAGEGDACGAGDGCGDCGTNCVAKPSSRHKHAATRIIEFIFTSTRTVLKSRAILLQAFVRVQCFRRCLKVVLPRPDSKRGGSPTVREGVYARRSSPRLRSGYCPDVPN